ncbi:MAG: hypothetical protein JJU29_21900 [Verrucomicrobia bacterium]|nr:hypothetical protein [Verrucomicrobiota bacterium]MCH8513712.1 hypothetical protein [Kiritimatiellia bacterium]
MKPIHLQPVLLALFLLLPGLACPETNGFEEWVRLIDLVRELTEADGDPNHTTLHQAFTNPAPFSEDITEHLWDAAPVFAQLDLLAAQTEWPPIDPLGAYGGAAAGLMLFALIYGNQKRLAVS